MPYFKPSLSNDSKHISQIFVLGSQWWGSLKCPTRLLKAQFLFSQCGLGLTTSFFFFFGSLHFHCLHGTQHFNLHGSVLKQSYSHTHIYIYYACNICLVCMEKRKYLLYNKFPFPTPLDLETFQLRICLCLSQLRCSLSSSSTNTDPSIQTNHTN